MSLHVTNPELKAKLAAQQRNSTIASFIVGILIMLLLALIFWAFKILIPQHQSEPMVSYVADESPVEEPQKEKVRAANVKKKPSSPSSAAVQVVTASAPSEISLPTPEFEVDTLSVEFGEDDGFGDGWGVDGKSGNASSGGAADFSFMGQKVKADEICFVIDWSRSIPIKSGRMELLQNEILSTLKEIPDKTKFQMIMYAGPRWLITDDFDPRSNSNRGTDITIVDPYDNNKRYKYKGVRNSVYEIEKGRPRVPNWLEMDSEIRRKIKDFVNEAAFSNGTNWEAPLEMAMRMKPQPKTIIFLTDGFVHNADSVASSIAESAKRKGVILKTVSLMESQAEEALVHLARETKGSFTLVKGTGKKEREVQDFSEKE